MTEQQLVLAAEVLGTALVSVQNELSPVSGYDPAVLRRSALLGLAFLAYGPLGACVRPRRWVRQSGVRAGCWGAGVSPQRVAIAWALAAGDHVIPIPGASRPESIIDSACAADLNLTRAELDMLGRVPQ